MEREKEKKEEPRDRRARAREKQKEEDVEETKGNLGLERGRAIPGKSPTRSLRRSRKGRGILPGEFNARRFTAVAGGCRAFAAHPGKGN